MKVLDFAEVPPYKGYAAPSAADHRSYDIALKVARDSQCSNKHGAVILWHGNVLAVATNRWHPNPHSTRSGKFTLHAEQRAMIRIGTDRDSRGPCLHGATLVSARAHYNLNSRPCEMCWALAADAGIKWIVFHSGASLEKVNLWKT